MPFSSQAQMRYMFANHPRIARRMADDQKKSKGKGSFKRLPKRSKRKKG